MERYQQDKIYIIKNSKVEAGVSEDCGHLYPIRFFFGSDTLEPMHRAPWINEPQDPTVPPMLRKLSGDFFCAPFGDSDYLPEEQRAHGTSANDRWDLMEKTTSSVRLLLSKKISGAALTKEISISEGESVIYQRHIFNGGEGKLPVGHHAMLKIPDKAYISFSDFIFGGTPPQPVENDSSLGRSLMKYPHKFTDIRAMESFDNRVIDASEYPFDKGHEDLYMVVSAEDTPFGWSAVSCPDKRWLWYSLKNPRILPNTVIWLSNGGRYYPPFSSRHRNVIGVEETASFFHLGHKASIQSNFLNEQGYRTYIELTGSIVEIPYMFGVVKIPGTFGRVKTIKEINSGIEITDFQGHKVDTKVNLNFIKDNR